MAMSILHQFPAFISLSSHKPSFNPHFPSPNSNTKCRCSCIIVASSIKKPTRASKKVRSDADLYNDIKEFLSIAGLPENHVPTMKELSHFGRQDLANVVRRRGYKFIRQLLTTSPTGNILIPNRDTSQTGTIEVLDDSEGQNEKQEVFVDISSNENDIEPDEVLKSTDYVATESNTLSLMEKVAKFIQHGELDEGSELDITNEEGVGEHVRGIESEDSRAYSHHQQKELTISSSGGAMPNGSVTLSVQQIEDPELDSNFGKSYISTAEQTSNYGGKDLTDDKVENRDEIRRLKFLLHQKELELTQLKGQIEKEKLTLSRLQTKAETKISQAHKLISEKETELHVAEETLSGLKEVEIDYSGNEEETTVELAGSFNGWDHNITMDLIQPSSSGSRIWRAVLWLYPGVYEIKFIIDGHWKIDPLRESITWNGVHNNILRVDR